MLTTHLSRPDNVLINRLGLGTNWKVPATPFFITKVFFLIMKLFFARFFTIIWRSGIVYPNHPFGNLLFALKRMKTLPLILSEEHVYKFYRVVRLRYSSRFKNKRFFHLRQILHYLNIGEFFFFRLSGFILIILYCHIPEPFKRKNFLHEYLGLHLKVRSKNHFKYLHTLSNYMDIGIFFPFFFKLIKLF